MNGKEFWNRMTPRDRYLQDPVFHAVVDVLVNMLYQSAGQYTPTELREAAMLAATIYEESEIRRYSIDVRDGTLKPKERP